MVLRERACAARPNFGPPRTRVLRLLSRWRAPPLVGEIAQPTAEPRPEGGWSGSGSSSRPHRRSSRPAVLTDDSQQMRYRSALGGGTYHFFERSSRKMANKRIRSKNGYEFLCVHNNLVT